ncbi:MAG TPA: efflux RND transporter periplasmic adaptor subunit [Pirellulaceae bacterium]|nr:efflux RND transporter periplasmic adaptor subunit [Pirellulaceae bacterium]HMO92127.1 efflux RND transporter periplasmic adaptor subunit [Pirellulaceae bacterium]HMP69285.1 efflux RND transporter periplasmic adaptor subunit [Pirellulaceae bacterium]
MKSWIGRMALGLLVLVGAAGILIVGRQWLMNGTSTSATVSQQMATGRETPAISVELVRVGRGSVTTSLEITGNFLPRRRTMVSAEVDGIVHSIPNSKERIEVEVDGRHYSESLSLDLGQRVSQGDILLTLDPAEYELELASANARLLKAQKDLEDLVAWKRPEEVRRLQALRDEAKSQLQRAEADFRRLQALVDQRATSRQEFDRAQAELQSAQATVERTNAELAEAEAGPTESAIAVSQALVKQAEAEVKIREDRLRRTVVRAPYTGYIVDRNVEVGQRVTAQPRVDLMELMDLSLVIVQVGIPERYLGKFEIGTLAQVEAAGSVAPVPGVVFLVNQKVDYETRTFRVRIAVENDHGRFKAGQFVKVRIPMESAKDSLVVPYEALVFEGGQPAVFVYDPHSQRVAHRNIKLGLIGDGRVEVVEGLSEGQQIVRLNPAVLADGMRVQPGSALSAIDPPSHTFPIHAIGTSFSTRGSDQ